MNQKILYSLNISKLLLASCEAFFKTLIYASQNLHRSTIKIFNILKPNKYMIGEKEKNIYRNKLVIAVLNLNFLKYKFHILVVYLSI